MCGDHTHTSTDLYKWALKLMDGHRSQGQQTEETECQEGTDGGT